MTETLGLTPSQTVGPYLTLGLVDGSPISSSIVPADDPRAIVVRGRLVDGHGDPVPDGMIEFWQANEAGRYAHRPTRATTCRSRTTSGASAAPAPRTTVGTRS